MFSPVEYGVHTARPRVERPETNWRSRLGPRVHGLGRLELRDPALHRGEALLLDREHGRVRGSLAS
jgi:hypothetical protein